MSLATRCSACNTVFRVVQDQLKVSEGWVRCGRCQAVFNALEGLFDLAPEPLPEPAPGLGAPSAAPPLANAASPADPDDAALGHPFPTGNAPPEQAPFPPDTPSPPAFEEPVPTGIDAPEPEPVVTSRPADFDDTPASRVAARDRIDFADAQFNTALLAEAGIESPPPSELPDAEPDDAAPAEPAAEQATPEVAPEFLRQAERDARWGHPRTVAALWLLSAVLLLALGLQAALHFRDLLAATAPQARPALEALCRMAGCRIEPLRRIEDIVIESSALTAAPGGDAVRLSVVLRNRGPLPLAMPSIELSLTDPGGQLLARRTLSPADFTAGSPTLAPASEAALQLVLSTGSRRASGYTVEPFYP